MSLRSRYTLSDEAYQGLLQLKVKPKQPRPNRHTSNEWTGTGDSIINNFSMALNPNTFKPYNTRDPDRASRGLSAGLNLLPHTYHYLEWIDSRPDFLLIQHEPNNLSASQTTPVELTQTHAIANKYLTLKYPPTYNLSLPWYTEDADTARYALFLYERTQRYFYDLAILHHMKPWHRGGRSTLTAFVSVALEAIGLHYLTLPSESAERQPL